jgi:hypothetical protein
MNDRKILSEVTAATGDRIIIGDAELVHALDEHFAILPKEILLELIEIILKDPTSVYEDIQKHIYHFFYRLENKRYLVVIVKKSPSGNYFCTAYPTGKSIRNKHKKLKKVKL